MGILHSISWCSTAEVDGVSRLQVVLAVASMLTSSACPDDED